jgi:hypothetical protein
MMYIAKEEISLLTAVISCYGMVLKEEDLIMAFNEPKTFA